MIDAAVAERIRSEVLSNDVVLYMKGTPVFPQCGFFGAGCANPVDAGSSL